MYDFKSLVNFHEINRGYDSNKASHRSLLCIPCLNTDNVRNKSPLFIAQIEPRKILWIQENVRFHRPIRYHLTDLEIRQAYRNRRLSEFFNEVKKKKGSKSYVFQTLTDAAGTHNDIRTFIKAQKYHIEANSIRCLGYAWVSECKRRERVDEETGELIISYHFHYHICWVTTKTKRISVWYKSEMWGRRVNAQFVSYPNTYMKKYLTKDNCPIINHRNFGLGGEVKPPNKPFVWTRSILKKVLY